MRLREGGFELNIVVEGIDKSGKTTFLNLLKSIVPSAVVIKNVNPPRIDSIVEKTALKEKYLLIENILDRNKDTVFILDRFYPSEMVYSQIKRGYDALEDDWYWDLDRRLGLKKVSLVYVESPGEVLKKRFDSCGEEYVETDEIELLIDRYHRFLEHTALPKLFVNGTQDNKDLAWSIADMMEGEM